MKILIAADMEGVSGVVHWDQVNPKHKDYDRFRKLMTGDVNAAIRGAFDGGAEEVIVADGHGSARNILVEELDPRARLNSGSPSPLAMVQGIEPGITAAIFVGYHARSGTPNAILDHTWSGSKVARVWLNGQEVGEIGLNAAVCSHFEVPLIMISGDQSACAEAEALLGTIETAVVKRATGRMAAECLPPEVAQQEIYAAAQRAVSRLQHFLEAVGAGSPRPWPEGYTPPPGLDGPVTIAAELVTSDMADRASLLPGARRLAGKRIEVTAENMPTAYRAMRAAVALAGA
jgi:D-amino peptidase